MLRICVSLFVTGIIMGSGPCLASCGPILISYIAGTKKSFKAGLWSWFVFSMSRSCAVIFLGFIAGIAGAGLFRKFYWEIPGYIIWSLTGIFICFLAVLIFLGKQSSFGLCKILNESFIQKDTKSLITLGLLVGIFPCVPLIGILSYITMISTRFTDGIILSACFALGALLSPMLFLGVLAGGVTKLKLLKNEKVLPIFQKLCAIVLFILGLNIIIKTASEALSKL